MVKPVPIQFITINLFFFLIFMNSMSKIVDDNYESE